MVRQDFDKLSLTLLTMTTLAVTLSLSKGLCELGELCEKKTDKTNKEKNGKHEGRNEENKIF